MVEVMNRRATGDYWSFGVDKWGETPILGIEAAGAAVMWLYRNGAQTLIVDIRSRLSVIRAWGCHTLGAEAHDDLDRAVAHGCLVSEVTVLR